MNNEFINQFNDSSKASFETLQQFNVINVEAMQKLAALQFSLTSLNVESTVEQAKLLTSGTDPQVLLAAESALTRTYGERLMQISSETADVLTQSREQLVAFAGLTFQAENPSVSPAKAQSKASKKTATKKVVKKAA